MAYRQDQAGAELRSGCSFCRHYTFYLWKDIIAAYPAARYCLVPLYLYAGHSIIDRLKSGGHSNIWVLGFFMSTAVTLIPAWLLELR